MKRIALFIASMSLAFTIASASTAETWETVDEWTDPFVGDVIPAARVVNDEGFTFTLFRSEDGKVRALYSLPASTFDRLPQEGRVLMIRPDDHDSEEIKVEIVPGRFVQQGTSNGLMVRDVMWHGEGASPTHGTFRNLLDSEALHARFFLDDGTTIDTDWSLEGSHPVIVKALGIKVAVSQEEKDWAKLETTTLIGQAQRCFADSQRNACIEAMNVCGDILTKERDKLGFDACMASKGF